MHIPDADKELLAQTLIQFLRALQKINPSRGPPPAPHNFYRGGALSTYDRQTRQALHLLKHKLDCCTLTQL